MRIFSREDRDMSQAPELLEGLEAVESPHDPTPLGPQTGASSVDWTHRNGWRSFGDRLDFLSPDVQHLHTGRLSIAPPHNPERRKRG